MAQNLDYEQGNHDEGKRHRGYGASAQSLRSRQPQRRKLGSTVAMREGGSRRFRERGHGSRTRHSERGGMQSAWAECSVERREWLGSDDDMDQDLDVSSSRRDDVRPERRSHRMTTIAAVAAAITSPDGVVRARHLDQGRRRPPVPPAGAPAIAMKVERHADHAARAAELAAGRTTRGYGVLREDRAHFVR